MDYITKKCIILFLAYLSPYLNNHVDNASCGADLPDANCELVTLVDNVNGLVQ